MTMPAITTVRYRIDLPFPISANRLWRSSSQLVHTRRGSVLGAPRVHLSPQYRAWLDQADRLYLTQKRGIGPVRPLGRFRVDLRLAAAKRDARQDGDNLQKCVLDWLQRVEIIRNDSLCEAGSWAWADIPCECRVEVVGVPYQHER